MTLQLPDWAPADPGAPPPLPGSTGTGGRVVAVVASRAAVDGGWAPGITLELARGWSAAGARLVLADGGLDQPQLEEALGLPPGEGLVDALRWGASVKRVARRPQGRSFFVITAGTPVPDGAMALDGPRWPALCTGFREAGVTLVILVPAADPCRDGVLREATEAVVLCRSTEDASALLPDWSHPVLAVLGRDDGGAEPAPAAAGEIREAEGAAPAPADPPAEAAPWVLDELPAVEEATGPETFPEVDELSDVGESQEIDALAEVDGSQEVDALAGVDGLPDVDELPEADALADPDEPLSYDELPQHDEPPAFDDPSAVEESRDVGEAVAGGEEDDFGDPMLLVDAPAEATGFPGEEEGRDEPVAAPAFAEAGPDAHERGPVPTFEEIVQETVLRSESRGRSRVLLVALLVLLVAVAAAALLGYLPVPGLSSANGAPAEVAPPTIAAPPPAPTGAPAAWSVALGAFREEETARSLAQELAARLPGVLVVTTPVEVAGAVLHRVTAGPAADSADAAALAVRIGAESGMEGIDGTPRYTPRTFALGEMPDLEAARRRADVLVGLGVPAYVLAVPFSDGSLRFRVHAGTFADDAEAAYLAGLLEARGLDSASLSDRTGHLPE